MSKILFTSLNNEETSIMAWLVSRAFEELDILRNLIKESYDMTSELQTIQTKLDNVL